MLSDAIEVEIDTHWRYVWFRLWVTEGNYVRHTLWHRLKLTTRDFTPRPRTFQGDWYVQ